METLQLQGLETVNAKVFKHFTKLKSVVCKDLIESDKGVRYVLQKCKDISFIETFCDDEIQVVKFALKVMKRRNNDLPLSLLLLSKAVRISPIDKNCSNNNKLRFEIFDTEDDSEPEYWRSLFTSEDEKSFLKAIAKYN